MKALFASLLLLAAAHAAAEAPCSQRCASHLQATASCSDLPANRQRACLRQYTPALSCQRQRDSQRCEALRAAQASCEGKNGLPRRQCVQEKLPDDASAPACRGYRCGGSSDLLSD